MPKKTQQKLLFPERRRGESKNNLIFGKKTHIVLRLCYSASAVIFHTTVCNVQKKQNICVVRKSSE